MSNQTNTISLDDAQTWATEWRDSESTYNAHNELNAFLIPADDLQQALDLLKGQTGKTYVRAYIGVKDLGNGNSEEKLMIVATKAEAQSDGTTIFRDLIYGKVDGIGATEPPTSSTDSGIFDFTDPCPPACDNKSPLN